MTSVKISVARSNSDRSWRGFSESASRCRLKCAQAEQFIEALEQHVGLEPAWC